MRWLWGLGVWALAGCASSPPTSPAAAQAAEWLKSEQASSAQRKGALRLRCTPTDAEVVLDGVSQGRCDDFSGNRGLWVGDGLHRIELKKNGYWPYVTYYEANGATAALEAELTPMAQGEKR